MTLKRRISLGAATPNRAAYRRVHPGWHLLQLSAETKLIAGANGLSIGKIDLQEFLALDLMALLILQARDDLARLKYLSFFFLAPIKLSCPGTLVKSVIPLPMLSLPT